MLHSFTQLENFGHSLNAQSYVIKARTRDDVLSAFQQAKEKNLTVTARGAGKSYNDASLNGGGIVLDMSDWNLIQEWNPHTGQVRCEAGVTLEQLWQKVEPDGWWPPVVSGTMKTTLGGCLSTNIHGKNNFQMGPIGEHVTEFTAILPTGAEITCSPKINADLFYSMISGLGMLGIFTSVTLQMKRIYSGLLAVDAFPVPNLHSHLMTLQEKAPHCDYIVGWLDTTSSTIGRGQIHSVRYLNEGEDKNPQESFKLKNHTLPARMFGVIPKSILYVLMKPFINNFGVWGINTAKYVSSLYKHSFKQHHGSFHFLLDYVPNWERSFGTGGLIQYQSFVPKETAEFVWTQILKLSLKNKLPSYLGVTKRHRPDKFLLSHSVDGFSLALDFKVTDKNRKKLSAMLQEFDKIVVANGGKFYFAKNSETTAETAKIFYGEETVEKFRKLKKRCDPHGLLESDLYRRIFGNS